MLVGQQLGPFAIEKELGAGAMGAVYLGRYVKNNAKVAVKVMLPGVGTSEQSSLRFDREAAILKQFSHPNIVKLYGVGKSGNNRYYAMEFIEGESLDHVLARRGRFTWEEVVTFGLQLCAALQHAHEQGVIHRDLKPSNLMILADGTLKLTDFGIAKDLDVTALTGANSTVGTAAYMSPEQCKGDPNLTFKSDLYSMGVVFYELITGKKPFIATNPMDMFLKHVKGKFERPSRIILDLPVWLDTVICQLLEKKPEQRPKDAAMVYAALTAVREKVETQRSAGVDAVAAQLLGGDSTAPKLDATDKEISRTLMSGKGKKKKRKTIPIFRRGWFVLLALMAFMGALGGLVYLFTRPPAPESLYQQAAVLMKSGKAEDRTAAREGPLTAFLRYYPTRGDEQAKEMNSWADQVDMEQADALMQNYLRKLRRKLTLPANSESEQLGFKAAEAEEAGDLEAASNVWKELQKQAGRTSWGILAGYRLNQLEAIQHFDQRGEEFNKTLRQFGVEPKLGAAEHEAYLAYRAEHFADMVEGTSDLALAQQHWEDIKKKYAEDIEQRYWYLLAAHRIRTLRGRVPEAKDPDTARKELIQKALDGSKLLEKNSLLDARTVCLHVIALYDKLAPFKEQVEQAHRQIKAISGKLAG